MGQLQRTNAGLCSTMVRNRTAHTFMIKGKSDTTHGTQATNTKRTNEEAAAILTAI